MQFQKGQSGNPAGRRKGAFSPAAILAQQMLDEDVQDIVRKTIAKAKDGNGTALRICWERIKPVSRKEPVDCELPPFKDTSDATGFIAAVIAAVARGDLMPREGSDIAKLVDTYLKTVEVTDFEEKLTALEKADVQSTRAAICGSE